MSQIKDEIDQLQTEINQLKIKVKEAIYSGVIFEEVKKITLHIKELEKKLASCLKEDKKII